MRAAELRTGEHPHRLGRGRGGPDVSERRQRLAAESDDLLLDVGANPVAAQAAFEVVGRGAREPGVRRPEEPEQVAAALALPEEAERGQERVAEGRLPEPDLALERIRNAGAGERRLERSPEPVERRADEPDRLRRRPVTQEVEHLVGDQLERTAGARPFEEAHGTLERRRLRVLGVREERALEVGERRVCDLRVRGRQLLDPTVRETGEIVGRAAQGGEGRPARLVGKRDVDLGATGEGPEQGPLRAGQVFEAVREHGPAVPRLELRLNAFDGVRTVPVAVEEPQLLELAEIGGEENGEVALELARVDEARLELRDGAQQGVAEAGEACGGAEPVQARSGERAPQDERALRVRRDLLPLATTLGDRAEEIVEGADVAAQQGGTSGQEIALYAIDLRPVRDDEERLTVEVLEVAIEEPRDLPRVRRANQQRERHSRSLDARASKPGRRPTRRAGPRLEPGSATRPTSAYGRGGRLRDQASRRRSRHRDRRPSRPGGRPYT